MMTDQEIEAISMDELVFLSEVALYQNILDIELVDRQHTIEHARGILTNVFNLTPDQAELHLMRYLYADET